MNGELILVLVKQRCSPSPPTCPAQPQSIVLAQKIMNAGMQQLPKSAYM